MFANILFEKGITPKCRQFYYVTRLQKKMLFDFRQKKGYTLVLRSFTKNLGIFGKIILFFHMIEFGYTNIHKRYLLKLGTEGLWTDEHH